MIDYGFVKELDTSFESAVEMVKEHLHEAGFGVLTTVDVKEKFAEKLGIDIQEICDPGGL